MKPGGGTGHSREPHEEARQGDGPWEQAMGDVWHVPQCGLRMLKVTGAPGLAEQAEGRAAGAEATTQGQGDGSRACPTEG